jgi:hypothetical protein
MTEKNGVVLTDRIQYYKEIVTNKGKNPEIFYNALGDAVEVKPGKSENILRAKLAREKVLVINAEDIVPDEDEEESNASEGSGSPEPDKG